MRLILIDGKNSLYRHQAVFNNLSREDGFPTGALFGCINSMLNIAKRYPEAAIVWVWDGMGDTWRHEYMATLPRLRELQQSRSKKLAKSGYKANRSKPEKLFKRKDKYPDTPRERALIQLPYLQLILKYSGIRTFEVPGLECDDLIGMLTKRFLSLHKHNEVLIHSGDHDFYQLLSDRVTILTRVKEGKALVITDEDIIEDYGVKPKNWTKYRALTGDNSDNIPHLRNVGGVVAKKMLRHGVDPSSPTPCCKGYEKYFEPYGVEKLWPCIHGNYKLCKLVTDPNSPVLSENVRRQLAPLMHKLTSNKRFMRSHRYKTSDYYRKVSFLLSTYELASILGRRNILWGIR